MHALLIFAAVAATAFGGWRLTAQAEEPFFDASALQERVARGEECADRRRTVRQWDNGDRAGLIAKYGDYAEDVVKDAWFFLNMRVEDPDAPDGASWYCPRN